MIYILLYLILYYVLVYECVLVQMLSARSGVLSFSHLTTICFRPFICGRSVVVLQVSCHLWQFELRLNHFAFVKDTMFFYCDDSLGSEKEF